ncbi:MAG TPA: hypothetical protein VFA11_10290 [Acidimicrobiales bacterium]|nr:hypothetical protein [Acidimicrobiales bacterium]
MRRTLQISLLMAGALAPAIGVLGASGATSNTGLGIRLGEVPANLASDPRAQEYIIDHVAPGTTIKRRIVVTDDTDQSLQVALYTGPARIQNGLFDPLAPGATSDLTRWSSVAPNQLNLQARQEAPAEVTIAVPSNAADGERYGVVWASLPPSAPPGGGVAVVNRVGVRIYLSVGNGPAPLVDFKIDSLQARRLPNGQPEVWAQVHNTGGRALDMTGSLILQNGPGGTTAGPFPAKLGTTLGIGQTEPVTVLLDPKLPAGPWDAVITLQSDEVSHKAEARIVFPTAPNSVARPVTAKSLDKQRAILLPLALGLLLLVILGGLFWFFFIWRRRKDEDEEQRQARMAARR